MAKDASTEHSSLALVYSVVKMSIISLQKEII